MLFVRNHSCVLSGLLVLISITASLCSVGLNNYDSDSMDANVSSSCPPWWYRKTPNSTCECGNSIGQVVSCKNRSVDIFTCHCMSYSEHHETVIMGSCPFLCMNVFYFKIPPQLDSMCNEVNRTGQLCGSCSKGYAPACLLYTSPSPRDATLSRMPSSA